MSGKIFEVGFPRTGTTSLCDAMRLLGVRATSTLLVDGARPFGERPLHAREMFQKWLTGRFDFSVMDEYEYIGAAFFPIFERIDQWVPDSRFILTVRDPGRWLRSIRAFMDSERPLDLDGPVELDIRMVVRLMATGSLNTVDDAQLLEAYERHNRRVRDHFAGTDRLLVMDVCAGDGWEKLCPFVDRPAPERSFPHSELAGYL